MNLITRGILKTALYAVLITLLFSISSCKSISLNIRQISPNDVSAYQKFIKINKKHRKPLSKRKAREHFALARDSVKSYFRDTPQPEAAEDLREKIIQELNIGFLLNGLDHRELEVETVSICPFKKYTEKKLLFKDPQVGVFSVLFLIPDNNQAPHPALVGLHGHGSSSQGFHSVHGIKLAENGFAVIMPSFRASKYDETEFTISRDLYLNGFTLMGLRVYETHLVIKYLKKQDFIDKDKIGIMGASAGSAIGYLTSLVSRDIRALICDGRGSFMEDPYERLHCHTLPHLVYRVPQVHGFSFQNVPSKFFRYGYSTLDDDRRVIAFFKKALAVKE